MTLHSLDGLAKTQKKLIITWRIQKNQKNGQNIIFASNGKYPHICQVCSAYWILLWAKRFGRTDHQPMDVYVNHQGIDKYLTGNKIAGLLQLIAEHCHPDLRKDNISHFSSHSGIVWAVVLFDKAGMNPDFIKT
jgi:hypothetical protein